jgi:hypothetical protein
MMTSTARRAGKRLSLVVAAIVVTASVTTACTEDREFSNCSETLPCPETAVAGQTSDAGSGGAPLSAGAGGRDDGSTSVPGGAPGAAGDRNPSGVAGSPIVEEGDHYGYVLDNLTMPNSRAEASSVGFDLNDDGEVDNNFGVAVVSLATNFAFDVNSDFATAIDNGSYIGLLDLETTALDDAAAARLASFIGENPIPEACSSGGACGQHLKNDGRFDVFDVLTGSPCSGAIENGVFSGSDGELPVAVVIGPTVSYLMLHGAQAELTGVRQDGFDAGRLGGAISEQDLHGKVFLALQVAIQLSVDADCSGGVAPECGCAAQSTGQTYIGALDANDNCAISLDEVRGNTLVTSLFPLDIDRDGDGQNDAISTGFSVSGVKARFTPQ